MNKVCTISIYYGKFKNYFRLWLRSCELNPTIDFLIITDIDYQEPVPANVKFIKLSLEDIAHRASLVLGFEVTLPNPYKLCDFRPLYGKLFHTELQQYEYWGHNDMDMVYGDIQHYLDEYNYKEYDKFLPLGHLSFYKNNDEVNNYYKLPGSKCGDYKTILKDEKRVYALDENLGICSIMLANNKPLFYKRVFADISSAWNRFIISKVCTLDGIYEPNYEYQIFYWEKGKLFRAYWDGTKIQKQEFIYIHLLRRPNFKLTFNPDTIDSFYITPSGFILKTGEVTFDIIKKLNPYKGALYEKGEYLIWGAKKVVEKIKRRLK